MRVVVGEDVHAHRCILHLEFLIQSFDHADCVFPRTFNPTARKAMHCRLRKVDLEVSLVRIVIWIRALHLRRKHIALIEFHVREVNVVLPERNRIYLPPSVPHRPEYGTAWFDKSMI
jgi:hypothetical protein